MKVVFNNIIIKLHIDYLYMMRFWYIYTYHMYSNAINSWVTLSYN